MNLRKKKHESEVRVSDLALSMGRQANAIDNLQNKKLYNASEGVTFGNKQRPQRLGGIEKLLLIYL